MELKPGLRLSSAVCDAQVVVVKEGPGEVDLACGGVPMVEPDGAAPEGAVLDPTLGDGPLMGKRYVDEESGVELLCSRGGAGALTVDGRPLTVKGAKPLPSSD